MNPPTLGDRDLGGPARRRVSVVISRPVEDVVAFVETLETGLSGTTASTAKS